MRSLGWTPIPPDWAPYKKTREAQGGSRVKQETEMDWHDVASSQGAPRTDNTRDKRKARHRFSPGAFRERRPR